MSVEFYSATFQKHEQEIIKEVLLDFWKVFTKIKDTLQDARRFENLCWRLWWRNLHKSCSFESLNKLPLFDQTEVFILDGKGYSISKATSPCSFLLQELLNSVSNKLLKQQEMEMEMEMERKQQEDLLQQQQQQQQQQDLQQQVNELKQHVNDIKKNFQLPNEFEFNQDEGNDNATRKLNQEKVHPNLIQHHQHLPHIQHPNMTLFHQQQQKQKLRAEHNFLKEESDLSKQNELEDIHKKKPVESNFLKPPENLENKKKTGCCKKSFFVSSSSEEICQKKEEVQKPKRKFRREIFSDSSSKEDFQESNDEDDETICEDEKKDNEEEEEEEEEDEEDEEDDAFHKVLPLPDNKSSVLSKQLKMLVSSLLHSLGKNQLENQQPPGIDHSESVILCLKVEKRQPKYIFRSSDTSRAPSVECLVW